MHLADIARPRARWVLLIVALASTSLLGVPVGASSPTVPALVETTQPPTPAVTDLPVTMSLPRRLFGAAAVWDATDEAAHVLGGRWIPLHSFGPSSVRDDIIRFDLASGTSTIAGRDPLLARAHAGVSPTADPNIWYLFGGEANNRTSRDDIVRYDVRTSTATAASVPLPSSRYGVSTVWVPPTAGVLGCSSGCAYLLGGRRVSSSGEVTYLDDVLRFTPRRVISGVEFPDSIEVIGSMVAPPASPTELPARKRLSHASALLCDSAVSAQHCARPRIYVFGGKTGNSDHTSEILRIDLPTSSAPTHATSVVGDLWYQKDTGERDEQGQKIYVDAKMGLSTSSATWVGSGTDTARALVIGGWFSGEGQKPFDGKIEFDPSTQTAGYPTAGRTVRGRGVYESAAVRARTGSSTTTCPDGCLLLFGGDTSAIATSDVSKVDEGSAEVETLSTILPTTFCCSGSVSQPGETTAYGNWTSIGDSGADKILQQGMLLRVSAGGEFSAAEGTAPRLPIVDAGVASDGVRDYVVGGTVWAPPEDPGEGTDPVQRTHRAIEMRSSTGWLSAMSTLISPSELPRPMTGVGATVVPVPHPGCPAGCVYMFGGSVNTTGVNERFDEINRLDPARWGRVEAGELISCLELPIVGDPCEQLGLDQIDLGGSSTSPVRLDEAVSNSAVIWDGRPNPEPGGPCPLGCAYIVGGRWTKAIQRFDPLATTAADALVTLPGELPYPIAQAATVWDGEWLYLIGGERILGGSHQFSDAIVAVHPRTGTVTQVRELEEVDAPPPRLPTPRAAATAVCRGGRVYVAGGAGNRMTDGYTVTGAAYNYEHEDVVALGVQSRPGILSVVAEAVSGVLPGLLVDEGDVVVSWFVGPCSSLASAVEEVQVRISAATGEILATGTAVSAATSATLTDLACPGTGDPIDDATATVELLGEALPDGSRPVLATASSEVRGAALCAPAS